MKTVPAIVSAGAVGLAVFAAPTAAAIPGYSPCPSPTGLQYEVTGGATCDDTWVAQTYDVNGDKYQQTANFTCYGSTVDQMPVVLTCVSENGELVVSAL